MKTNYVTIRVLCLMLITGFFWSFPVWAEERQLMEISSENLYDGSIKVLFILTEVHDPKMFYYKTPSAPKVVCDFYNVKVKPGLRQDIRVNKNYIQNVRLGEHHDPKDKVRVVLDLIPGFKYSVKEIPPEPNIFSVIIKSDTIASEISHTSVDESPIKEEDVQRESFSTKIETSSQSNVTTTVPRETQKEEKEEKEEEEEEEQESPVEKNTVYEDNNKYFEGDKDQDDDEGDDVFSEESGWIENLIDANVGLQAPNKWPVQKNFGNIKLIVHLDKDPNGFVALKGYAINMSEDFLYRIQLNFDILNDNADVIEQAYAEFFNVEPGERRKINSHIAVKKAIDFRLMQQLFW